MTNRSSTTTDSLLPSEGHGVDSRRHEVAIIGGGGHTGLPFGLLLARAGYDVALIDNNEAIIAQLERGEYPYVEDGAPELFAEVISRLHFATALDSLTALSHIVVDVGTPVMGGHHTSLESLWNVIRVVADNLRVGQTLILRTTLPPGATELAREILERRSGLQEGRHFSLAYCPERATESHLIQEASLLPQIVGAFNRHSHDLAAEFFSVVTEGGTIQLSPVEAELAKLVSNMTRYVSFAMANEVYRVCSEFDVDAIHLIELASRGYPRLSLPSPGPNVGGPCLIKDGVMWASGATPSLMDAALRINAGMPRYIVSMLSKMCAVGRCGVLGLTFKANCDDTRDSLSFDLINELRNRGIETVAIDPYQANSDNIRDLRGVDALILMTPHDEFAEISDVLAWVDNPECIVVDIWGFWPEARRLSRTGFFRARDAQSLSASRSAGAT